MQNVQPFGRCFLSSAESAGEPAVVLTSGKVWEFRDYLTARSRSRADISLQNSPGDDCDELWQMHDYRLGTNGWIKKGHRCMGEHYGKSSQNLRKICISIQVQSSEWYSNRSGMSLIVWNSFKSALGGCRWLLKKRNESCFLYLLWHKPFFGFIESSISAIETDSDDGAIWIKMHFLVNRKRIIERNVITCVTCRGYICSAKCKMLDLRCRHAAIL